jgi:hypothetical protein
MELTNQLQFKIKYKSRFPSHIACPVLNHFSFKSLSHSQPLKPKDAHLKPHPISLIPAPPLQRHNMHRSKSSPGRLRPRPNSNGVEYARYSLQ